MFIKGVIDTLFGAWGVCGGVFRGKLVLEAGLGPGFSLFR